MSPARGALRLGRAAVLGATCLLLALTGHVLAGGAGPSIPALLVLAVPVGCISLLMTGRRAGALRIASVLAVTQAGLHEAFMLTTQAHCAVAGGPLTAHAHGTGPATTALRGAPVGTSCAAVMPMAGPSMAMVAAHVLAATLTGLVLWQGERLLWVLLTWLAGALPTPTPAALPPIRRPFTPPVRRVTSTIARPGGVGRRGPPACSAA